MHLKRKEKKNVISRILEYGITLCSVWVRGDWNWSPWIVWKFSKIIFTLHSSWFQKHLLKFVLTSESQWLNLKGIYYDCFHCHSEQLKSSRITILSYLVECAYNNLLTMLEWFLILLLWELQEQLISHFFV